MNCVGKLLIMTSLCIQAYLLLNDNSTSKNFDSNAGKMVASCSFLNNLHLPIQYYRLATIGLFFLSALMIFKKWVILKVFPLIGLLLNLMIVFHPINKVPSFSKTDFWQHIAVIGGIIYLMGADVYKTTAAAATVSKTNDKKTK